MPELRLRPSLAKPVLERLGRLAPLPNHGFLAGGAVANTLLEILWGGKFPVNDLDIYTDLPAYYNNWGYYDAQQIDAQIYDDDETGYTSQVLFTPWYDPDSPPWEFNAEFTVNFTQTSVGGQLQFTDLSTGIPLSWQWDFNSDGILDSEEQNPVWSYNEPGLYTVKQRRGGRYGG